MGVAPQMCLQVKESPDADYLLFYSNIEGFEFEPGYEYELLVNKQTVPNPPADASSFRWTLIEVVSKAPVEPAASLEGVTWELIAQVNQNGFLTMTFAEATMTLQGGEAGGRGGCNLFFAPYVLDGNQLTFGPAGSTMMACEEPIMAQEQAFLANLEQSATYEIVADQLHIFDEAGEIILAFRLQAVTPLTGTLWQATMVNNGREAVVSLIEGTELTATFQEDGTVFGTGGCNNFSGGYTVDGDQISIGPLAMTMMFCVEPEGVMEQEMAFAAALESAAVFAIQGDTLELRTADGALAVSFVAAAPEAAPDTSVDAETMDMLGNLAYSNTALFTYTVQLVSGIYTETLVPDSPLVAYVELTDVVAAGELNGQPAYAAILVSNSGGSGVFNDLAVVMEVDGQWTNVATTLLGDRVAINSLTIENNQVVIDMITQGPDDPMCCPTQQVVIAYELVDGELVEAAPASTASRAAEGGIVGVTWEWVESLYSDDTSIEVYDPSSYTMLLQPDGSVILQVDCNRGGGSYTLDDSQLTLDVAVMTRVACPEGTLSEVFMRDLNAAATYMMDGEDLVISLFADAGVMRFQPGPVAAAAAEAMSPDMLTMSVEGVAESYEVQVAPAMPYDASMPPGPVGAPEHVVVTFDGQSLDEASFAGRVIYLIQVDAYEALWLEAGNDYVAKSVADLEALLAEQPADPEALPVLPPPPAVMDLAVQVAYLDVPGLDATGVRWVGRFSQDASPVLNYQLRYLFQGLTNDGQYLISASYPITTTLLPDSMADMTADEQEAFNADPMGYLEATASALTFLAPSDFNPSLDALDAMIQSLSVAAPEVTVSEPVTPTLTAPLDAAQPEAPAEPAVPFSDLVGPFWQWIEFSDAVNGAQPVADPAKYQISFVPSGTVRVLADCNRGAGQYRVDGASLQITVQAMTRAMCQPGSLSNEFVQRLNAAAIWFVQDGDLFIDLFADSGTMRFTLVE